ncbi:MAG TPA: response regulator [Segetibacter sp.]
MTITSGITPLLNLFSSTFWLSGGFYIIISLVLLLAGFIYFRLRVTALKNAGADVQSQLTERSEMLKYAMADEQKARSAAELAERTKRELLAKLSHEIRIPMTTMLGMASLLAETNLTEEQREYSSNIITSGDNLITIINDILMKDVLQYSKVESGNELESKEFDLVTSIEEVLDVFAAKAAHAGINLLYRIDKDVPLQLVGDAARLRQILMNLIENAFRFTTKGEIFVGVRVAEPGYDNRLKLQFEVRDTGSGMTPERLGKVSKELAWSDADNKNTCLGLTLIICKRLINLMEGTIKVDSRENEGTVFTYTICTSKSLVRDNDPLVADMAAQQGKKVLIADENLTSGNLLKKQLEDWNLVATVANSNAHALQLLSQNPGFDLVLADANMHGVHNAVLTHEIKSAHPLLPVILLNRVGNDNFRLHGNIYSAVINKPVKKQMLGQEILNSLKPKNSGGKTESKLSADFSQRFPLNILIAEDDAMNQQMVKMVLKKLGYEAHSAATGKEVLEMVSQRDYDVILMDVQMPEMDGLEATRMIRICLSTQPIVIAMTANTLQGDREDCMRAGMDDYLSKPLKIKDLVTVLEKQALKTKRNVNSLVA